MNFSLSDIWRRFPTLHILPCGGVVWHAVQEGIGDEVIHGRLESQKLSWVCFSVTPLWRMLVYCKINSTRALWTSPSWTRSWRGGARFNTEQMHKRKNEKKPIDSSSVGSLISKSEHWRAQKSMRRQEIARYNLKLGKYRSGNQRYLHKVCESRDGSCRSCSGVAG